MSHKTLVGGTAYNITGGKSMVSGTAYNITGGRTLVGGTGYNIGFGGSSGDQIADTAMLYSDGNMVFQFGDDVESGKTLTASYTGFGDADYANAASVPWNSQRANIKNIYCRDEITPISMAYWFFSCSNIVSFNMVNFNINNVTNMFSAYSGCTNLTGSPVCGNNVTNMFSAYRGCTNLTGSPVCGQKVTNMSNTYRYCENLTGSPVCGNNVTDMSYAYAHCTNLTGSPICGKKVTNMYYAYRECANLTGNAYFYSSTVNRTKYCFYEKNNSRRLNIYVPSGSTTNTTVHYTNSGSLVGKTITWTNAGSYQYNTAYNIYIYPVANVAAAAIANGDEEANANAGITITNEPTNNWTGGSN